MSELTKSNAPKTRRWQAVVLTALVLAGGSIALPQAADAAVQHQGSTPCKISASTCSATGKLRTSIGFQYLSLAKGKAQYTVKTPQGRTLCSGKVSPNKLTICRNLSYVGPVKITLKKSTSLLAMRLTVWA